MQKITESFLVVSHYQGNDVSWITDYSDFFVIYNQGNEILHSTKVIKQKHLGADLYDKLCFIIERYEELPDVTMFIKSNLFKFISKDEFDLVCHNKTFTPLLTKNHKTYMPVCFYDKGIYWERNDSWYVPTFPSKFFTSYDDFSREMGLPIMEYIPFAPGSNYIVPKENILKHPKSFYVKLMGYIDYTSYSAETQMLERALYTIWQ